MQILLIIAGVVAAAGTAVLGWQIWKSTTLGVPLWVWGVGGIALLVLFFSSETGKKATDLGITAGKIYITKGALKNPKHLSKQTSSQLRKTRFFTCGNCGQKFLNNKQKNDHEKYCNE